MKKLTLYDLEYIIKKFEPKTREEFADFGLKLKAIGSGAYRQVYEIIGYEVVVKIPTFLSEEGGSHSRIEWNAFKKVSKIKKYKQLRPFLPKIYTCSRNGIVLMKKYDSVKGKRRLFRIQLTQIQEILDDLFDGSWLDIYWQNVAIHGNKLKIIDFGCFPEDM